MSLSALLLLTCCLFAVAAARSWSAEMSSVAERCIANGLVDFQEATGSTFNHHPEKQRELRGTDTFLTSLETDTSFQGVIADLPAYCQGSFHREGSIKLLFKTTKRGWRPIYKAWTPIKWETHDLYDRRARDPGPEYFPDEEQGSGEVEHATASVAGDRGTPSPWVRFETHQNTNTLGLGCTVASRAAVKLLIVDDQTSAIVAARVYTVPIQIESWYLARCLRKFSLESQAHAKRCSQRAIAGGPSLWKVRVKRVSCDLGRRVAQAALQLPAYSEGATVAQQVEGWRCYYASRGAVSCQRGSRHIYTQLRSGAGDKCERSAAPAGVKSLKALGASCGVASELASSILAEPGSPSPVGKVAGGGGWDCAARRFLAYEDQMTGSYNCFSGRAAVSFSLPKPKQRLIPSEQTVIPAGVVLPGQGHEQLFTITPEIKFSENAKWTRSEILISFTAEPALVGQRADIKLEKLTAKCEWTSDEMQDTPICPSMRRTGRAQRRSIVLEGSQTIEVGPRKRRGNWIYRLTVSTRPFSLHSLSYRKTSHAFSFWMIYAATHCERNPWCHHRPKQRRGPRSEPLPGGYQS